ncbi:hypothetical protein AMTR_s00092p00132900 [Amborella trichopoda]|uniref:Uncharacterized protein n=1 Tax=Amborella trichopoda TaxID=13333 RepID=W1NQN6_AMBTC|nr:hypothetical protein AMTR_s00092p00132900 [Amborella trichopoda]
MRRLAPVMKTHSSNAEGRSNNKDTHSSNTEGCSGNEDTHSNNAKGRSGNEDTRSNNAGGHSGNEDALQQCKDWLWQCTFWSHNAPAIE